LWRYVLHYPYPLNEPAMADAARLFEGEHDFTAFAASTGSEEEDRDRSLVRRIFRSEVFLGETSPGAPGNLGSQVAQTILSAQDRQECLSHLLVYVVRGHSFLRYMVRKMVGTLLEVGKGRLVPEDIPRLFELRDRSRSGPTIPPHGLCLLAVEYPEQWEG
jgi:tRNA pseudouridine38-40 synthase